MDLCLKNRMIECSNAREGRLRRGNHFYIAAERYVPRNQHQRWYHWRARQPTAAEIDRRAKRKAPRDESTRRRHLSVIKSVAIKGDH